VRYDVFPYAKGKINALNTLLTGNFPGLDDVLGEVGTTQVDLIEMAKMCFIALYGQSLGTSWNLLGSLFTKKKKSPKSLPPKST